MLGLVDGRPAAVGQPLRQPLREEHIATLDCLALLVTRSVKPQAVLELFEVVRIRIRRRLLAALDGGRQPPMRLLLEASCECLKELRIRTRSVAVSGREVNCWVGVLGRTA